MVGLGDAAPEAVLSIERDEMVDVVARRLEIEDERPLTVHPECERRDEGALHAVRSIATQRDEWRAARFAVPLLVDWQAIEEILHFARRVERPQDLELGVSERFGTHGGNLRGAG